MARMRRASSGAKAQAGREGAGCDDGARRWHPRAARLPARSLADRAPANLLRERSTCCDDRALTMSTALVNRKATVELATALAGVASSESQATMNEKQRENLLSSEVW